MKTKEVVKVKFFYNSIREDFVEINKLGDFVIKKQREVLSFDWLDDTFFNKWMEDFLHSKQLVTKETDDEEVGQNEMQTIDTSIQEEEEKDEI